MTVIVVLPAYNAVRTLRRTVDDIPFDCIDELLLVDDCSLDETVALAEQLRNEHPNLSATKAEGRVVFLIEKLPQNRGYGGNQKHCYNLALEHGADIVVMVHPDYQYDPKLVRYFVEFIKNGYFDVMLGSRIRSRAEARAGGMPAYKYYANRFLTLMANIVTGRNLSEWHTGMRAYRSEVLKRVPYQGFSDDFIFDAQMLFSVIEQGFTVGDISVPVRYFEEASSINFKRSIRYGLLNIWEMLRFALRRLCRIQPFRYLLSGAVSAGVNLTSYVVLVVYIQVWYLAAAVVGFLLGAVTSFILQKFWTFEEKTVSKIPSQFISYLLILIFNGVTNTTLLAVLVEIFHFNTLWAAFVTTGTVSVWSFFVYRYVVFAKRGVPFLSGVRKH